MALTADFPFTGVGSFYPHRSVESRQPTAKHMTTRAANFLKKENINFELVKYDHQEKGAVFAARATGYPLERTVKTLVVDLGEKRFCLALVPGDRQLDFKLLAGLCSVKKAAMADTATAERLTGYLAGGISPFGTRQTLPVVMEKEILSFMEVLVNAGRRGVMLRMKPADVRRAADCRVGEICR
jgi:Cys-tRNA(Pro)/Cys-tRNA(Cys) deacylase